MPNSLCKTANCTHRPASGLQARLRRGCDGAPPPAPLPVPFFGLAASKEAAEAAVG